MQADYSAPTRQHELDLNVQIRDLPDLKYLDHEVPGTMKIMKREWMIRRRWAAFELLSQQLVQASQAYLAL